MHSEIIPNIKGIDTFLYVEGKGDPLVLLHGMVATSDIWTYVFNEFKDERQVIAPDLPGHGRSQGSTERFNLEFYTGWLSDLLDELKVKRVTLAGNSMGGAISLAFAMKYPGRVERLVLSDALGLGGKIPWSAFRYILLNLPFFIAAAVTRRVDPYLLRYFQPWVFLDPWGSARPVIEKMAEVNLARGPGIIRPGLSLLASEFFYPSHRRRFYNRLASIKVPTMIIWGRYDGLIPVDHARLGARQMPEAEVHIFENSSHSPMAEQPQLFIKALHNFLGKTTKQRRKTHA
jgi:pimeloyl-ACP methyl ester carboxylesterase